MTDKELLELAAKAALISGLYRGDTIFIPGIYKYPNDKFWNPLTDDGDALRLAVKLSLDVDHNQFFARVYGKGVAVGITEKSNDHDPYAATRRAIVRAAAEIGKEAA